VCAAFNLRRLRALAGGGITPWERVSVVPSVGRLASGVKDQVAGRENPARNAGEARTKKDLGAGRGGGRRLVLPRGREDAIRR